MEHNSWTHRIARIVARPMVGTSITPNQITTLRLLAGLAACIAFASGSDPPWVAWGGILWVFSAFLDRVDGELARLGKQSSRWGHTYDYVTDVAVNSLFFVAIGIGLRDSALGGWAILLGLVAGACVALASLLAERLEQREGGKAYSGAAGFDFDDVLYLFGPIAWLGWLLPLLVGAAVGAPAFALWTWLRVRRNS